MAALEILLVEDNEGDVLLTKHAFRGAKPTCNISVAHDGVEALELLRQRGEFTDPPVPQLILLDLNMPRMDGRQFLEAVKQDEALRAIPVVMLTSSRSPTDVRECYDRHASCYVVKPFDGHEFEDAIRRILSFWGSLALLPT